MNLLTNMKTSLVKFGNNTSLTLQRKSPEIFLGLGIVGFVGTVVLACRATLKAEEVLDRHNERMEKAKEAADVADVADNFDIRREKTVVWAHTVVDFTKLYGPSVALGAVSMACFAKSYKTLNGRYIGAVSAFNGVTEAFQAYRKRVVEEEGEERDRHYRYGTEIEKVKVEALDENGKKVKKEEVHEIMNTPISTADIPRFFDESNPNWDNDPRFNLMFIRAKLQEANDILHARGHLFLNEVYDMLGYEYTATGQVVGWTMKNGCGYVSFGLDEGKTSNVRRFVNGVENVVLLEFNVDGVILDQIEEKRK